MATGYVIWKNTVAGNKTMQIVPLLYTSRPIFKLVNFFKVTH